MATHADPATDAIVVNKPSLLAEQYRGPLPLVTLDPLWDHDRLARTLEDVASRYARVWYVKYRLPDEDPAAQPSWLDLAWDTHAYTLDARSFTDVDLSLWETGGHLAFHGYDRLEQQTALVFGDALRLDGVTVHGPGAQWGRGTRVTLQWTVLAPPDSYLSVYVHLLDDQGFRWGLGDTELLNERFEPTVFWQAGDVLSTELALRVSPGTAPDEYRLILGVYDRLNHQPLEAQGESGESLGGSVSLGTLAVLPSSRRVDPQSDIHLQMRLDAELAAGLRLVGWNRDWERLRFGEALSLALVWQATASLHSDYRLALWLEDAQGNRLAEGLFELASERYPTSQWAAGEVIQRHYPLRVAADAPAGEAQLIVQLVDGDGQPVGQSLTLLSPFLEGRRYDEPDMAYRQAAQVGEAIRLVGYGLSSATVSPGQVLNLTLCWQAISTPPGDYTVFTHLYAPDGSVVAQHDGPPMLAYHPTSAWQPGEYVLDEHPMAIGDLPPGNYRLGVGLYDPSADNTRLPLAVDGERQPDDRLLLDTPVIVQAGS